MSKMIKLNLQGATMKSILVFASAFALAVLLLVMDMAILLAILSASSRIFTSFNFGEYFSLILATIIAALSLLYMNMRHIIRQHLSHQ